MLHQSYSFVGSNVGKKLIKCKKFVKYKGEIVYIDEEWVNTGSVLIGQIKTHVLQ